MARSTRRLAAATVCALALGAGIVAGCGGDEATTTVTVSSTAAATTTAAAPLTLAERVPTADEFSLFRSAGTEVVGMEAFLDEVGEADDEEADRQALTTAGFERAALQKYEAGDAGYAISYAVEVSESGAPGLLEHVAASLSSSDEPGVQVTPFEIPEIPGARAVNVAGDDDGQPLVGSAVVFTDGAYLYGIQVAREGAEPLQQTVTDAATKLHGRVAGAPAAAESPAVTTETAPTTPSTETTGAAFPDAGEQALLAHVPEASKQDCERTSDTARAGEATSSVRCETEGFTVYYEQFATTEDMEESYQGYLTSEDIERGEGTTCDEGAPAEGTWNGDANRVACWENGVGAWVTWTHADLNIISVAVDTENNLQRLFKWWESPASGPVA